MADCGIKVLAHQGNRALVRVTCTSCNDENLLQIVIQTEAEAADAPERPQLFDEPRPDHGDPIGSDELLDLHNLLTDWSGDLAELTRG
jgi:hypothetical protein